jgi:hypothetical protein
MSISFELMNAARYPARFGGTTAIASVTLRVEPGPRCEYQASDLNLSRHDVGRRA